MDTTQVESSFLSRRQAEMEAGRARFDERNKGPEARKILKAAEREIEEDERRRAEILGAEPLSSRAERDRAGAEIIDQAQTELEAVGHLADQQETITTLGQQLEVEKLEGNADPAQATAITTDVVTAQAVNQPTILAANEGVDTVNQALNTSGMADDAVALDRLDVPEDKHVPKVRPQAEKIAKGKVPPAAKVVKPANETEAVEVVRAAEDDALGL